MYSKSTGYGQALLQKIANYVPTMGRLLVVKASADTADYNYQAIQDVFTPDTEGRVRLFSTLNDAYAEAQTNNNDVILLDGHTAHTLTAPILWAKNRIHVIGMDGGDRLIDQGSKVQCATAGAVAYVIKVTGIRNSFRNIKFIQGSTVATALNVVADSGEGSVYKNCSFTFGVIDNLGSTSASEFLCASDSASYLDCTFGSDTLLTSAARQVVSFKTDVTEPKSNVFRTCNFIISSSSATATFVRLAAITDILFTNLFDRCVFQASIDTVGGIALTAGAVVTGTGTAKGTLNFAYPSFFNVGGALAAGGTNVGVQVVAPVSSATAIKGITPTA